MNSDAHNGNCSARVNDNDRCEGIRGGLMAICRAEYHFIFTLLVITTTLPLILVNIPLFYFLFVNYKNIVVMGSIESSYSCVK